MNYRIGLKIRMIDNLIQKKIFRLMSQSESSELTYMNFWVICFVNGQYPKEVYQKDIEQSLSINRATASKMLTTMERKGLIVRAASDKDGRLKKIILKERAFAYCESNRAAIDALEEVLTKGIPEEDIKTFLRIYGVIKANLEE